MSIVTSENATHRANLLAAEQTKQAAVNVAGASAATIKAAEIAFARSALASAVTNSCSTAQWTVMLTELGTGGA